MYWELINIDCRAIGPSYVIREDDSMYSQIVYYRDLGTTGILSSDYMKRFDHESMTSPPSHGMPSIVRVPALIEDQVSSSTLKYTDVIHISMIFPFHHCYTTKQPDMMTTLPSYQLKNGFGFHDVLRDASD